jgi:hypothetical protein
MDSHVDGQDRGLLWHGTSPTTAPVKCNFDPIINGPGLIACMTAAQSVCWDSKPHRQVTDDVASQSHRSPWTLYS